MKFFLAVLMSISLVSSMGFAVEKHWKKNASHGVKAAVSQERNYWEEVQIKDKEDITFIIDTLAYKSLASVFCKKKKLEEAGDRINHLHPLRFLLYILSDPKLNAALRAIYSRDLLWSNFVGGTYSSLKEESDRGNMQEECVSDFCSQLGINDLDVRSEIVEALQTESWSVFMQLLFLHVPRNEGFDRYDM